MNGPLPTGCHCADSASALLGISKRALLKKMRELGWLHSGQKNKNMPRSNYVQRGYLTTQERSFAINGIKKRYSVMLLTQIGFAVLQTTLAKQMKNPQIKPLTEQQAQKTKAQPSCKEREECLS